MNRLVVLDSFWIPQILNLLYSNCITNFIPSIHNYIQNCIENSIFLNIDTYLSQDFLKLLHILIIRMAVFL